MTGLLVTEGLSEGCRDGGLVLSSVVQAWNVCRAFLKYGTDEQKRRYLPALADGSVIGAFSLTEPDSGSDAFAMRTHAVPVEGGWSLTGRKSMVTNGPEAGVMLCFARTGEGGALGGISVMVVDTDADGVTREPAVDKMGLRTSATGDVSLDQVFVPDAQVLGKVGAGLLIFNHVIEWERIYLSAYHVGAMQRDVEDACIYARQRTAFGQPISSFQATANRIVDMKVRLEAARLLTYRAAWTKARTGSAPAEAAIAKLHTSEAQLACSLDLIQVHGSYGYVTEAGVERRVRDAVAGRFYSGTSELLHVALSRSLRL